MNLLPRHSVRYTHRRMSKSDKIAKMVEKFRGRVLDAHYLAYFDFFNRQLFYEAHDVLENLWPQPYLTPTKPGAYQKDKLEVWLNKQVCTTHTMTLEEAQQTLVGDWHAAYVKAGLDK